MTRDNNRIVSEATTIIRDERKYGKSSARTLEAMKNLLEVVSEIDNELNHTKDLLDLEKKKTLNLSFGEGKYFIADYQYSDCHATGVCVYPRKEDDGRIGVEDYGSKGKDITTLGSVLTMEFSNVESIDVMIDALMRVRYVLSTPPTSA